MSHSCISSDRTFMTAPRFTELSSHILMTNKINEGSLFLTGNSTSKYTTVFDTFVTYFLLVSVNSVPAIRFDHSRFSCRMKNALPRSARMPNAGKLRESIHIHERVPRLRRTKPNVTLKPSRANRYRTPGLELHFSPTPRNTRGLARLPRIRNTCRTKF